MASDMSFEILVLSSASALVGAIMVLIPLAAIVTGRLKYSRSKSTFTIGKTGPQVSVGPVLATLLAGAALVFLPTFFYYRSYEDLDLAARNETLQGEIEALESQNAALANQVTDLENALGQMVEPPEFYSFSGRIRLQVDGEALEPSALADLDLALDRVLIQRQHPPRRVSLDGGFSQKLYRDPDGVFPEVAMVYPTTGTNYIGGTTTIRPDQLEVSIAPDGTKRIEYIASPLRENVVVIDLYERPR